MENDVYKAPESELNHLQTEGLALATRGSRFCAAILDSLIVGAISIPVMILTGVFDTLLSGGKIPFLYNIGIGLVSLMIYFAINGRFLIRDGQTIGKKAVKIKIVTDEEGAVTLPHIAKRYGFYFGISYIPIIGGLINLINILCIFRANNKCLHDNIANTKVIAIPK